MQLEFEHTYYDVAVKHVSHNVKGTSPISFRSPHWHNGKSDRQWSRRPVFNPKMSYTKDSEKGT